jgi:hypothetical protein
VSRLVARPGNEIISSLPYTARVPIYGDWTALPVTAADGALAAVRVGTNMSTMIYDAAQGRWLGASGMTKIADGVLSAGKFDFPNIPQLFTHLMLIGQFRTDQAQAFSALGGVINGDAGNFYRYHLMRGVGTGSTGASFDSTAAVTQPNLYFGSVPGSTATTGATSTTEVTFPFYKPTDVHKSSIAKFSMGTESSNSQTGEVGAHYLPAATVPINRLTVQGYGATYNLVAPSRCSLFGLN